MPGETSAFLMLSSDYKVLRSTVSALNNFIQYSHWQIEQLFRLASLLLKAFATVIPKHIVCLYVRFPDKGSCLKFIKMRATPFVSVFC